MTNTLNISGSQRRRDARLRRQQELADQRLAQQQLARQRAGIGAREA